jgi:hypothetical protein
MVTTRITEYRQTGLPGGAEVWVQIGGHVLDRTAASPVPVAGAWVHLETPPGQVLQTATTNTLGRFTFGWIQTGQYRLSWRAAGFPLPAGPRQIEVPSPTGEYDLAFT